MIGNVNELLFRDPDHFVAGELHKHGANWAEIAKLAPSLQREEVLSWIGNKVSIFPYCRHFKGTFKEERSRGSVTIPISPPTDCSRICQNNAIKSTEIRCNFSSGQGWPSNSTSYRFTVNS